MSRDFIKGLKFRRAGLDPRAIADVVEQGYLAKRRESAQITKKTFSPSTIGYGHGTCPRYWWHAFSGAWFDETRTDAQGVANMETGTNEHTAIQEIFEKAGLLEAAEVEIKIENPPIRGFLDALINWEGETVVAEFKTTRQEMFIFREVSGKPAVYHLIQLLIYLRATGHQRGFLLYFNKNDQTVCVIPVEMSPENEKILEDVFGWLRAVRNAWALGDMPERPFRKNKETGLPSNKVCNSCPVQRDCFAAGDGMIKIPRMELPVL